jgi:pimeloyl-ACP methyl ester carboxylesterase
MAKRARRARSRPAKAASFRMGDAAVTIGGGPRLPQSAIELPDAAVEEALRSGENQALLEDLFGTAAYVELRALAREAAARSVRGGERLLIVPGIMGSKLGYKLPLIDDVLWIGPLDIVAGRLGKLRLDSSGGPGKVKTLGVLLFAYLALKLRLRIWGYDAEFAPFDWRLGILGLGDELAKLIDADQSRKTHVVAHSMGGLVTRAALRKNPKQLGRVVTLGTPNYGSYSPVQAFRGVHSIVQKIAAVDVFHNQADLAEIFGTFRGLLEMIPKRTLRPSNLFDLQSWPKEGMRPDQKLLRAADAAQQALPEPNDKFYLIVGLDNETVVDARLNETRNEFLYDLSTDGDGTVPLDLARVDGRPTWVTNVSHGNMPNSETVAKAVDEILSTGTTSALQPLEDKLAAAPRRAVTCWVSDSALTPQRTVPSEPTRKSPRRREEMLRTGRPLSVRAQRTMVSEFAAPRDETETAAPPPLSMQAPGEFLAAAEPTLVGNLVVTRQRRQRIEIDLVCGSITDVRADAYVVGVFRNVTPDGATAAIDRELSGALHELIARRMVSGEVGEVTSFPTGRHRLGANAVMMAGLGTIASYSDSTLELVGESIMRTALLTRLNDFAIVPLGAASGSHAGVSFEMLLRGFVRALNTVPDGRLRGFAVCELDPERFNALRQTLYAMLRGDLFGDVEITLQEQRLPAPVAVRANAPLTVPEAVYLLVREETTRQGAYVAASVLTAGGKAAIVQGRQRIKDPDLDELAKKVAEKGVSDSEMSAFGSRLADMVLPREIRDLLGHELGAAGGVTSRPLVVVHDAAMSRVPWETLQIGEAAPALGGGLTHRYDGGVLSVAKWREEGPRTPGLNVLLVINPTADLDKAECEGRRITKLFTGLPGVILDVLYRNEATRRELLRRFQLGKYDVVHFAGHAYFDPNNRARSGILCAGGEVLAGADLATLSRLPSLVFFNACEAARVRGYDGSERRVTEPTRGTIGFAESFLAGGVANYLGTYWPVTDTGAEAFATSFYTSLLRGDALGSSLIEGRKVVREKKLGDWANYVLYGRSEFRLALAANQSGVISAGRT